MGEFVLVTVHAKRGKDGMKAAGILPVFTGTTVHEAGKLCDTFENVAGRALRGAHELRELVVVTETDGPGQATGALLALHKAAGAAHAAAGPGLRREHEGWYRQAAGAGIALNAGRNGKLQDKRHALATRDAGPRGRLPAVRRDLRVPFTNNAAEQDIRMSKLRTKISGCMRSMAGTEGSCAIRSCPATAARHGTGALEALTSAFQGGPGSRKPGNQAGTTAPD